MSFVSFYANDANKEIWIMIIWISLSTDLISIGGLVLVSMDHLDLTNSKDMAHPRILRILHFTKVFKKEDVHSSTFYHHPIDREKSPT